MKKNIALGEASDYSDEYDASLLEAIPRKSEREAYAVVNDIGYDIWNSYELSWLRPTGVPDVALAEFQFPASSRYIVESKSFKYYLNSFNQTVFDSRVHLHDVLVKDLTELVGAEVSVVLMDVDAEQASVSKPPGVCVDNIDIQIEHYQPSTSLLHINKDERVSQNATCLYSHLLKSNCPVTDQPDWATVWIQYSGATIPEAAFLAYIVSFRQYQGFHESCVERIFSDLMAVYAPESLCVYARYTRRGGLDINPVRMTKDLREMSLPFGRLARQ